MINNKILIRKNYLFYAMLLLPFLLSTTSFIIYNPRMANILLILKLICFSIIVLKYLGKSRIGKFDIALIIYLLVWLLAVVVNQSSFFSYAKEVAVIVSYVFLAEYSFEKKEFRNFIKAFTDIVMLLLIMNFIILIIKPHGLFGGYYTNEVGYGVDLAKTRYNLLGLDNSITVILIIGVTAYILNYMHNKCSREYLLLNTISIIGNIVLLKSSTMYVAILIMAFTFLIAMRFPQILRIKYIYVCAFVVFLIFFVFKAQDIFSVIIVNVLHKDLTLTSRTLIWERTIEYISESIIIGHGIDTFSYIFADRNAHNMFLQIASQSGLLGIVALINIFRVTSSSENKNSNKAAFINSCMLSFLICCISEVYAQHWLILMLLFVYLAYDNLRPKVR